MMNSRKQVSDERDDKQSLPIKAKALYDEYEVAKKALDEKLDLELSLLNNKLKQIEGYI